MVITYLDALLLRPRLITSSSLSLSPPRVGIFRSLGSHKVVVGIAETVRDECRFQDWLDNRPVLRVLL